MRRGPHSPEVDMRWGFLAPLGAILLCSPAMAQDGDAAQSAGVDIPTDPTLVSVQASIVDPDRLGADAAGEIVVSIVAQADVGESILEVAYGGVANGRNLDSFAQLSPSERSYAGVAMNQRYRRNLGDIRQGQPVAVSLPLAVAGEGRGYVAISILPGAGNPSIFAESATIHVLAQDGRAFAGGESFQGLEEQRILAVPAMPPGVPEPAMRARAMEESAASSAAERIRSLRQSGATTEVERRIEEPAGVLPAPSLAPPPLPLERQAPAAVPLQDAAPFVPTPQDRSDAGGEVTISGVLSFTDVVGGTHPVTFASITLVDAEPSIDRDIAVAETDAEGRFTFSVSNRDTDGTGIDPYIIASAAGATVEVVRFDDGDPHRIASVLTADAEDLPDGTELVINLTATNDTGLPNNVAFEVYEAANKLSRFVEGLEQELPPLVTIRYPRVVNGVATDSSDYSNSVIRLGGSDAHDWDNIMHEYGHHLQMVYALADSPGGPHSINENLCLSRGKGPGIRLAWGEAWPTFFGTLAQRAMGLDSLGIPDVGDTRYIDTKPTLSALEYDLEAELPPGSSGGEGNELTIQRALFDIYDASAEDPLESDPALLWQAARAARPTSLSEYMPYLQSALGDGRIGPLGGVLVHHRLAAGLKAPADGHMVEEPRAVTFEWSTTTACGGNGAEAAVRVVEPVAGSTVWQSPFVAGSSYTPTETELASIFDGGHAELLWLVLSRDPATPQTGAYASAVHRIGSDVVVEVATGSDAALLAAEAVAEPSFADRAAVAPAPAMSVETSSFIRVME
ncbi:transthyretin-like family protein [Jiella avicenniae]|uniref:Transthyretin-like family protein n=1 Tax=Jiella avicenniae TaxID=2907202 RepID=A0A9X1P0J0_9HYPH|nr:transthyretin-like family protein [Jiella avicenniae]MCE7028115.1 transthyretin-like family protein [Jiella avicenniae]